MQRGGKKLLSPYGQKQVEIEKFVEMVQDLLQKEKLSRHMSLSHEEEKTQNKYKLVLCVDNYNGGERGRERTKILYVYTQRKKKY